MSFPSSPSPLSPILARISWHGPVSKTKDADRPSRAARRAAASAVPARRPPLRRWRGPVGPPRAVAGARRRGGRALHEAGAGRGTGGERFGRGPRGGRPRGRRGGGHGEGAQHSGDVDRSDRPRGDALSAPGLEAVRVVATSGDHALRHTGALPDVRRGPAPVQGEARGVGRPEQAARGGRVLDQHIELVRDGHKASLPPLR
mmetsp:Transcript_6211/g.21326  ORF Transcript_6211/g.21326 Transcript_6211/m.21326 type:complete len:202 (+) Transcript_6211:1643-2248(+)